MKLGIMADSHDNLPLIDRAVAAFEAKGCEMVIHCGDYVAPFAVAGLLKFSGRVVGVLGNNDGEVAGIQKKCPDIVAAPHVFEVAGRRVRVTHDIADAGDTSDVDVVLCGHSHEAAIEPGSPLTINPGETGGWLGNRPTVVVLDTDTLEAELVNI